METLDLSPFFATKAEANDFLSRISAISDMMYQTNFSFEKALKEHFGVIKSDKFLTLLRDNNINSESLPAIKEFFHMLEEKIPTLPTLSLTVAFEPQQQTLNVLTEWCLANLQKQMLFDITVDPKIVGGALISNNGRFFDFSIRPTVTRVLEIALSKPMPTTPVPQTSSTQVHQDINNISFGR